MDFVTMQGDVLRSLEESGSDWATLADVKDALNEAQEYAAEYAEYSEAPFTLTRQANTTYYDLNNPGVGGVPAGLTTTPILTVKRVFNVQTNKWLDMVAVDDLDYFHHAEWERAVGETQWWFLRGLWLLGLAPRQTTTTGTITLYGTVIPAALSADVDTPAVPDEFHQGWVDYAVYDLLCQDGEIKKAQMFRARYDKSGINLTGGYEFHFERLKRWVNQRTSIPRTGMFGSSGQLWPKP